MLGLVTLTLKPATPQGPVARSHFLIPSSVVYPPSALVLTPEDLAHHRRVRLTTPCTVVYSGDDFGMWASINTPPGPTKRHDVRGHSVVGVDLVDAVWRWAMREAEDEYEDNILMEAMQLAANEIAARLAEIPHQEVHGPQEAQDPPTP